MTLLTEVSLIFLSELLNLHYTFLPINTISQIDIFYKLMQIEIYNNCKKTNTMYIPQSSSI